MRPDKASLLGERLAKDDLTVHRDHREDKRKPLAVAVRPCGSDLGPKTVIALVHDVVDLKGRGLGFVRGLGRCACHDEVPFVPVWLVATLRQTARNRAGVMSYTGERREPARAGH